MTKLNDADGDRRWIAVWELISILQFILFGTKQKTIPKVKSISETGERRRRQPKYTGDYTVPPTVTSMGDDDYNPGVLRSSTNFDFKFFRVSLNFLELRLIAFFFCSSSILFLYKFFCSSFAWDNTFNMNNSFFILFLFFDFVLGRV
ncbi:hypothetical protein Dimus_009820 [Dionaea muscipula]